MITTINTVLAKTKYSLFFCQIVNDIHDLLPDFFGSFHSFFKKGLTNPPFHIIIYANRKIYNQGR